jgi:hypothetical protein
LPQPGAPLQQPLAFALLRLQPGAGGWIRWTSVTA